jgi:hypothetical protein
VFRVKLSDFGERAGRQLGRSGQGRLCVKRFVSVSDAGWDVRPFHGFAIASVNKRLMAAR